MKSKEEIQNTIELYADMVQGICALYTKQQAGAGDVSQTVFLKYTQSEPFRDHEHKEVWLLKVTVNARRERFRGWSHKHVDLQTKVEACADPNEASHFLLDILNRPPPHYRDVLYLFYYEGYKVWGIFEIKREDENTIHTWLERGREVLREKPGDEPDDFR